MYLSTLLLYTNMCYRANVAQGVNQMAKGSFGGISFRVMYSNNNQYSEVGMINMINTILKNRNNNKKKK